MNEQPQLTIDHNGDKYWRLPNGELHREDGPAVEFMNGEKCWWLYGDRHRIGGPAVEEPNGDKEWYVNGDLHREDGPAIEFANGAMGWFLHGQQYSFNAWKYKLTKFSLVCINTSKHKTEPTIFVI